MDNNSSNIVKDQFGNELTLEKSIDAYEHPNKAPQKEAGAPEKNTGKSDILKFIIISLLIVIPIRIFVAQPFIVSGTSMVPTYANGDYLIVDELSYRLEKPKRGDVIIFRYPLDPSTFFIKRIIGLPKETVVIKDGAIIIKNAAKPNGFVMNEPYLGSDNYGDGALILGDTEYFVMGDNRSASSDSRKWGPLDEKFIEGRPLLRLLPVSHMSLFPGAYHSYDKQ